MPKWLGTLSFVLILLLMGCGGGTIGSTTPPPPQFSFSLSTSTLKVFQTGQAGSIDLSVNRNGATGSLSASVASLPSGATVQTTGLGSGSSGTLTITPGNAAVGVYNVTVSVSDGHSTATQPLQLTIGISAAVETATTGHIDLAMSTSFQPAEWDYQFFNNFPAALAPLTALGPSTFAFRQFRRAFRKRPPPRGISPCSMPS